MLILSLLFIVYSASVYLDAEPRKHSEPPRSGELGGWDLWQEKNCQSCHQLYGLGGYAGPDLTNTFSANGEQYMRSFIKTGTDRMPNFGLTDKEVDDLISFLAWVDKSGWSKVPDSAVHWSGSYLIYSE